LKRILFLVLVLALLVACTSPTLPNSAPVYVGTVNVIRSPSAGGLDASGDLRNTARTEASNPVTVPLQTQPTPSVQLPIVQTPPVVTTPQPQPPATTDPATPQVR